MWFAMAFGFLCIGTWRLTRWVATGKRTTKEEQASLRGWGKGIQGAASVISPGLGGNSLPELPPEPAYTFEPEGTSTIRVGRDE